MRTNAEHTRGAIRHVAAEMFRRQGYRASTLEGIGAAVGLTRGSVLHHFSSKSELLTAVTAPYLHAAGRLVDEGRTLTAATPGQQQQFVRALAGLLVEHRGAVALLGNDVSARAELGVDGRLSALRGCLLNVLFGTHPTPIDELRTAAALGALALPLTAEWFDPDARAVDELVDAALRAAGEHTATHTPATTMKDRY